ncbi:ribonuclease [Bombiscardovia nodaiensis]|uniref:Ribonuclease n=1 Tax=Bombiscardovia nodaiensis TaxID=2932181 RepID=A0ABM8B9A8_9BIFI|nr:ribonuclease [Bombiscardovia nodaiensis]
MSGQRVRPSLDLEGQLAAQGCTYIVGLDEVGRGALAGPVMVGAAAIPAKSVSDLVVPAGLADSKMLSATKRESMVESLKAWSAAWAVGAASNQEIDEWGIVPALGLAALRALQRVEEQLAVRAESPDEGRKPVLAAILDGPHDYISPAANTLNAPALSVLPRVTTQIKADASCASVACASVIAKVTRDRLMVELAGSDPALVPYDWAHNKGYGSPQHLAAIEELGPTAYHRVSWHLTSSRS